MDKGPWDFEAEETMGKTARVYSGDFERDVVLYVSGDFADDSDRREYCEWLADVLNRAAVQPPASDSAAPTATTPTTRPPR